MTKTLGRWMIITACAGVWMAPSRAIAQLSAVTNSVTGSTCTGTNNSDGFCGNAVTFPVVNTGTTFTSRYAWNINADVGIFSTRDTSGTATHNVGFSATAPGSYRVTINTNWAGDMNRLNDLIGCNGQANVSGVSGSTNILLSSGSLALADPGAIGNGSSTTSTPFATSASATINRLSNSIPQAHTLTFTWSGSVRSNSCEAAVRLGQGHGTVTGCTACAYPGSPARTQSSDGHFVQVNYVSFCGNGILDGIGEACDQGSANGTFTSCCATNCTFKAAGSDCRSPAGPCDLLEECTGASANCPADQLAPTTTVCRGAAGVCDAPENCTGGSPGCPFDFKLGGSTTCRGSAGVCDVAEVCDGTNDGCPSDVFQPSTTSCRGSAGPCDVAESCTGGAADCPADGFQPSSLQCRGIFGPCDVTENCTGSSAACPPDGYASTSTTCRAATDVCDVAENCTGGGPSCPADAIEPAGTVCRPTAGVCDEDEECNGASKACPTDSVSGAFVTCRPTAGVCDMAENCDGVGINCPADGFLSSSTVCRATADVCDVAENCTGSGVACPGDIFLPASTICRPDAGQCDVADNCTGGAAACPADAFEPGGTACSDGSLCTAGDTCDGAGVCDSGINVNTTCAPCEACDPLDGSCGPGPRTDCLEPTVAAKARVLIKDRSPDRADLTVWKWIKGEATTLADFGDPTTVGDDYTLCVFDDGAEVFRSDIPAGGTCGTADCWRPLGATGFKYINRDRTPDGILKVLLKSGTAGRAKVIVKGKGDNLPYPGTFLPMMTPVKVQLQNVTPGTCWQTTHMSTGPLINAIDQFKAVSEGPVP